MLGKHSAQHLSKWGPEPSRNPSLTPRALTDSDVLKRAALSSCLNTAVHRQHSRAFSWFLGEMASPPSGLVKVRRIFQLLCFTGKGNKNSLQSAPPPQNNNQNRWNSYIQLLELEGRAPSHLTKGEVVALRNIVTHHRSHS